jgi:uncharacterized protein YjbJ (UPF0337 family)
MKDSTKANIEGTAHELKGAVKERVGRVVGNPDLEYERTGEEVGGKIQKKVGDIEKVFEQ